MTGGIWLAPQFISETIVTFLDRWQSQLPLSYTQFAQLATKAPKINLTNLMAAAILWPVRRALEEEDDGFNALAEIGRIVPAVGRWGDDPWPLFVT